jgi:hypothetical protein
MGLLCSLLKYEPELRQGEPLELQGEPSKLKSEPLQCSQMKLLKTKKLRHFSRAWLEQKWEDLKTCIDTCSLPYTSIIESKRKNSIFVIYT